MMIFLFLLAHLVNSDYLYSEVIICPDREFDMIINNFSNIDIDRFRDNMKFLSKNPSEAVACLINKLHPVQEKQITPQDWQHHRDALRVIWSIRALRYLTGGNDFTGTTKYKFKKLEENREYFLKSKNKINLPFFNVWMSRDIIYVAPIDVQKEVIKKWGKWYSLEGKTFEYHPVDDINMWYF